MFIFKKLFYKLLASFLLLSITPLIILLSISLTTSSSSIEEKAYDNLESIRAIKKQQLLDYFHAAEAKLELLRANKNLNNKLLEFNQIYSNTGSVNSAKWKQLRNVYQPHADKIIEISGWYDLFFISSEGVITFSQAAESDLGMSLTDPYLSSSSFGKLYQQVSQQTSDNVFISDFQPYTPSNNAPAAFMMVRMKENGYLALQIPLDKINAIMQQRDGMGDTGESYLVGQDKLMRSDSYLDPAGHSVEASLSGNVSSNGVDTEAVRDALSGRTDSKIVIDYNGNPVLSAYTPFTYKDITWALLVEIDEAEAFYSVSVLWQIGIITFLGTLIIVCIIATYIANNISQPIKRAAYVADKISQGDLTQNLIVTQQDEVGTLEQSIQTMNLNLAKIISQISSSTEQQSAAAEELSMITERTSEAVLKQQSATDVVASAIAQMSSSISEVSSSTGVASQVGEKASLSMASSNKEITQVVSEVNILESQLKKTVKLIEKLK